MANGSSQLPLLLENTKPHTHRPPMHTNLDSFPCFPGSMNLKAGEGNMISNSFS